MLYIMGILLIKMQMIMLHDRRHIVDNVMVTIESRLTRTKSQTRNLFLFWPNAIVNRIHYQDSRVSTVLYSSTRINSICKNGKRKKGHYF
jgi:hypothetical protein